jgi:GT2 family glycosyltransferase
VLNFNGRRYLERCLTAVLDQELQGDFEVLLVDNASTDGSVEQVRACWPQVRVVEAESNLGFAAGNNLGIQRSRGRHLVLLNNDTRVRPGWLRALVDVVEHDSKVGAVTSKLVFMETPDRIQNAGSLILSDGSGGDRGTGQLDRGQFDRPEEVFAACGAAMLLSRSMLDDVGLLDPTFFAYYEDTDLSWRMRLRGWRIVYEPRAVVEHAHSGTSVEWSPFFTFHVDRNRLFMIVKNAPPRFVAVSFLGFALMAIRSVLRGLVRSARPMSTGRATPTAARGSRARTHARVVASLLRHMPEMLAKRRQIRTGRRVTGADISRWFYPREQWTADLRRD